MALSTSSTVIASLLQRLNSGVQVPVAEVEAGFAALFDDQAPDQEIISFLTFFRWKRPEFDHLTGAARMLRERMVPLDYPGLLLDTCGTGGDHQSTINISTGVALVLAAAGVKVAKHGNRAVSSTSGSSDVLSALGVHVNLDAAGVKVCLDQTNLGFCFAPRFHPCLKRLAPIRRQLGFPTILNLLGPLANPARTSLQLIGVGQRDYLEPMARALLELGTVRAAVVHGAPTLDEISLAGPTEVLWFENGAITQLKWTPKDFALRESALDEIRCASAQESAARLTAILKGDNDTGADWIFANAAAGLLVAQRVKSLREGVQLAQEVIRSGRALQTLEQLKQLSQSMTPSA
jgi:anthranilate phosphoribosyltransferase